MRTMSIHPQLSWRRSLGFAALIFAHALLCGEELTTTDGTVYSGEIVCTAAHTVFLEDAQERLVLVKKRDLGPDGLEQVSSWEGSHPDLTELPSKFDSKPTILRRRIPDRRELGSVNGAVIMFALVIDESGTVDEVFVKDSSDERIVEPTRAAMQHWAFAPLTVDATPSRGVIFMPVQF